MGYTIRIGNATPREIGDEYCGDRWIVEGYSHEGAPTFPNDEMTGNSSSRFPSYSGWEKFVTAAGIEDLFHDVEHGLMRKHPGTALLTESHWQQIKDALESWKQNAHLPPGFTEHPLSPTQYDGVLARLLWLEYWFRWVLDNCKTPAIYNS